MSEMLHWNFEFRYSLILGHVQAFQDTGLFRFTIEIGHSCTSIGKRRMRIVQDFYCRLLQFRHLQRNRKEKRRKHTTNACHSERKHARNVNNVWVVRISKRECVEIHIHQKHKTLQLSVDKDAVTWQMFEKIAIHFRKTPIEYIFLIIPLYGYQQGNASWRPACLRHKGAGSSRFAAASKDESHI